MNSKSKPGLDSLQEKIGVHFENPRRLLNAFVHRSYLNENRDFTLDSNERLEFLGDACLELVVSEFLYREFPEKPEGALTNYRSALVNTLSLAETARDLQLGQYLLLSKGEEEGGGRDSDQLLANTFEALLGACYLETNLDQCGRIVENFLLPKIESIIREGSYKDAKSNFQEQSQEILDVTPEYRILKEWGPDHNKRFRAGAFVNNKLVGIGEGTSKQRAELAAATAALENWQEKL